MEISSFSASIKPDWEALVRCIERKGTPERVHFIELFLDREVQTAICEKFGLLDGLDPDDPDVFRIDLDVSREETPEEVVETLTAFMRAGAARD